MGTADNIAAELDRKTQQEFRRRCCQLYPLIRLAADLDRKSQEEFRRQARELLARAKPFGPEGRQAITALRRSLLKDENSAP